MEWPDDDEDNPASVDTLSQLSCPTNASFVTPKPRNGDTVLARLKNQQSDWVGLQTPEKEDKSERSRSEVLLALAASMKEAMQKKTDKASATLPAHAPCLNYQIGSCIIFLF